MFSAIPAVTTLSVSSPTAHVAASDQATKELKTNNSEQLETRSVRGLKEDNPNQRIDPRKKDEEQQASKQTKDKTSFQSQPQPQSNQVKDPAEKADLAATNSKKPSVDVMV
ncbi:MAG: hypothetical protein HQL68_00725 [Magnetococcales bacterium]|nr:hypothetical protein [Magnetococcales bacterium]